MHPIQQLRQASIEAKKRPAHPPMQAAHASPRCQHIRDNGRRCAAPALRGQGLCHFHTRATDEATYDERWFPVIEDATSLQIALARVQRFLLMDGFEFKRATALLYSLQIACMNLKNLKAENPHLGLAEDEPPQLEVAVADNQQEEERPGKSGNGEAVAEAPAVAPAKGENVEPPPRLGEDPEDLYVVALREGMAGVAALLGKAPATAAKREEKVGGNGNGQAAEAPSAAPAKGGNGRLEAPLPARGNKLSGPATEAAPGDALAANCGGIASATANAGCAACSRRLAAVR